MTGEKAPDPSATWTRAAATACSGSRVDARVDDVETLRRITRRMPRMQVYLPDALYRAVKERSLPASELLQKAVTQELRRQELLEETDKYLADLVGEVGEPTAEELFQAETLVHGISDRVGAGPAT